MTPGDVIPVYAMMNGNFKGGLNNVMLKNKDPVDSRYDQRAWTIDIGQGHTHRCVRIRSDVGQSGSRR